MTNDMIRLDIRVHPGKEQKRPDNKLRRRQPPRGVKIRRGKIEYPSTLHTRVQHVKRDTHQYNSQRHPSLPFQQQRENKRTLHIMYLEKNEEYQRHQLASPFRKIPEKCHSNKNRSLHQHPPDAVIHRSPPLGIEKHTVTRFHEIQGNKDNNSNSCHHGQKNMKRIHPTILLITRIINKYHANKQ